MGQRLNVEIEINGNTAANCYYHWSAYTSSAMNITKNIVEHYMSNKQEFDAMNPVVAGIRLLESSGAHLTPKELEQMQPFTEEEFDTNADRNSGLISISGEGVEETRSWEEGRVTINLTDEVIDFEVVSVISPAEYKEWYEEEPEGLPHVLNLGLHEMKFDQIDEIQSVLKRNSAFTCDEYPDTIVTVIE